MTRTWARARGGVVVLALASTVALGACKGDRGDTDRTDRVVDRTGRAADEAGEKLNQAWVTAKIQAKYFGDQAVKGRNIDVDTNNGVVTLSGQVESEQARQRAIQIARETDGVARVNDRLTVAPPASGEPVATSGEAGSASPQPPAGQPSPAYRPGSDQDVLARVRSQFFAREPIRHSNIDVSASGGVVTLSGQVPSESLRQEALSIAQATPGVQHVEDRVELSGAAAPAGTAGEISPVPPPPTQPTPAETAPRPANTGADDWITTQIQSRYFEDVLVKDASIEVSSAGGTVTLQGTVPSEAARQQAVRIAREVSGVKDVQDKLTVGTR